MIFIKWDYLFCLYILEISRIGKQWYKGYRRRHRTFTFTQKDHELFQQGWTVQSANLVQGLPHHTVFTTHQTTGDLAWSVLSQWISRLSLNNEHLLGIRRDFYCTYSDYVFELLCSTTFFDLLVIRIPTWRVRGPLPWDSWCTEQQVKFKGLAKFC